MAANADPSAMPSHSSAHRLLRGLRNEPTKYPVPEPRRPPRVVAPSGHPTCEAASWAVRLAQR